MGRMKTVRPANRRAPERKRPRGDTRELLLRAAGALFAAHGYRETRTQDVCRLAHANIAAVNYHFGGTKELYRAVWDWALERAVREESGNGRLSSDPDRTWLYKYVHACVLSVFDTGSSGTLSRLMACELADPSPISAEILSTHVAPRRAELERRLRRMVGPGVTDYQVGCCLFAIHAQFTALAISHPTRKALFGTDRPSPREAEQFAREICAFVIGGIRAIRPLPPALAAGNAR